MEEERGARGSIFQANTQTILRNLPEMRPDPRTCPKCGKIINPEGVRFLSFFKWFYPGFDPATGLCELCSQEEGSLR